jgi:hypothetical protein
VNCNVAAGLGDVSEGNAKVYQLKKERKKRMYKRDRKSGLG